MIPIIGLDCFDKFLYREQACGNKQLTIKTLTLKTSVFPPSHSSYYCIEFAIERYKRIISTTCSSSITHETRNHKHLYRALLLTSTQPTHLYIGLACFVFFTTKQYVNTLTLIAYATRLLLNYPYDLYL